MDVRDMENDFQIIHMVMDKVELENMMNSYFISKIRKLREGFPEPAATAIPLGL